MRVLSGLFMLLRFLIDARTENLYLYVIYIFLQVVGMYGMLEGRYKDNNVSFIKFIYAFEVPDRRKNRKLCTVFIFISSCWDVTASCKGGIGKHLCNELSLLLTSFAVGVPEKVTRSLKKHKSDNYNISHFILVKMQLTREAS